jgi:hypothetical protein
LDREHKITEAEQEQAHKRVSNPVGVHKALTSVHKLELYQGLDVYGAVGLDLDN